MRMLLAATLAILLTPSSSAAAPLSFKVSEAENWRSPSESTRSRCSDQLPEDDGFTEIGVADLSAARSSNPAG